MNNVRRICREAAYRDTSLPISTRVWKASRGDTESREIIEKLLRKYKTRGTAFRVLVSLAGPTGNGIEPSGFAWEAVRLSGIEPYDDVHLYA